MECEQSSFGSSGRHATKKGRPPDIQKRLVKVEVLIENIDVDAGGVHVGWHGQGVRVVDVGMGGGRRSGILAWTGSVSSRSSGMTRVGGEHCILYCLMGHATRAAATGAFQGSPAVAVRKRRREVEMSVPRLLLALCRLPLDARRLPLAACPLVASGLLTLPVFFWNGANRKNSVGEGGWSGGKEDAAFAGWSGVEIESRAAAARLRFGTRPPRCTQAPVLLALKASINLSLHTLICGGLDRCSCGEGPLVERSRLGSACMLCTVPLPWAKHWGTGGPGGRGRQVDR